MQTISFHGVVLQTIAIRESDLIVQIFTQEEGRVHAVARGARKSKKRFVGGIDIFDCGVFHLARKTDDAELCTLSGFDREEIWLGLRQNLMSFALGSLLIDITGAFAHPGDHNARQSYTILIDALRHVSAEHKSESKLQSVCAFVLALLRQSGYDPTESPHFSPGAAQTLLNFRTDSGANDFGQLQQCLKELLNFIESTLGQQLRSRRQLPPNLAQIA